MCISRQKLRDWLRISGTFLLDILFPIYCLGCQKTGFWICDACLFRIPRHLEQRCPACLERITPSGQVCFSCVDTKKKSLDGLFVATAYHEPLLAHAIHTWKYRFIPGFSDPLGRFLITALEHSAVPLPDLIIPVPLHPRRLRFRGFNQSELLARVISHTLLPEFIIPLEPLLIRTRYTKPQMKTTSRAERLANLKHAFSLNPKSTEILTGRSCWLIDDVATTGTTLEECALVLKQHGATSVFGIVLAR